MAPAEEAPLANGERFNSISHLIGAAMAVAGASTLMVFAACQGEPLKVVSFGIYGGSLITLYLISALYHGLRHRAKAVFRKLDHIAIYLLIAGSYTPISLVTLRGAWGWSLFGVVWGLAVVGIVLEFRTRNGPRAASMAIYLVMGWLALSALVPLLRALPAAGVIWLLSGGLFYTSGLVFYARDRKGPHYHGLWHLFVMAGSACHFVAIFAYVSQG